MGAVVISGMLTAGVVCGRSGLARLRLCGADAAALELDACISGTRADDSVAVSSGANLGVEEFGAEELATEDVGIEALDVEEISAAGSGKRNPGCLSVCAFACCMAAALVNAVLLSC